MGRSVPTTVQADSPEHTATRTVARPPPAAPGAPGCPRARNCTAGTRPRRRRVLGRLVVAIAVEQPVAGRQAIHNRAGRHDHFGMVGRDDTAQRERQEARIHAVATVEVLRQGFRILVPGPGEDGVTKIGRLGPPARDGSGETDPVGDGRCPVQRHLAHRCRVGEYPAATAYLPDALVRLPPRPCWRYRRCRSAPPTRQGRVARLA
jgi:hypothetical protein